MMKYEPTLGPWTVEVYKTKYDDIKEYAVIAPNPDAGKTGVCYSGANLRVVTLDSDGDAYLMSAALDFKIACEAVIDMIKSHQVYDKNAQQMLELVLAKANGEDVILPWWP